MGQKILVVGTGSIGCRHVRNLQSLGCTDIAAYDADPRLLKARCKELKIDEASDYQAELDKSDAMIVCSPPSSHVDYAIKALQKGKYVFLEKPVASDLSEARKLLDHQDRIMVGYNVRYHPLLAWIEEVLPTLGKIFNVQMEYAYDLRNARPNVDYRDGYYAKPGEGGLLLDHSHELDYARQLFGPFRSVFCSTGKVSDLEIDSEDNANLVLQSNEGFPVVLHFDYIQRRYARNIKIVAEDGVLTGDFAAGCASLLRIDADAVSKKFPTSFDETYIAEMKDFLQMLGGERSAPVTLASAIATLEICEAARESNRTARVVDL